MIRIASILCFVQNTVPSSRPRVFERVNGSKNCSPRQVIISNPALARMVWKRAVSWVTRERTFVRKGFVGTNLPNGRRPPATAVPSAWQSTSSYEYCENIGWSRWFCTWLNWNFRATYNDGRLWTCTFQLKILDIRLIAPSSWPQQYLRNLRPVLLHLQLQQVVSCTTQYFLEIYEEHFRVLALVVCFGLIFLFEALAAFDCEHAALHENAPASENLCS